MIYGQMNPEIAQALRGRLGLGTGIRNASPTSYQAPQFPAGMSQYTPQPHLPYQLHPHLGDMTPGNTGIVPPHMQGPWSQPMAVGGAMLPPPTPIKGPYDLPTPTPIGGPKSPIQQVPGASVPQENPIPGPNAPQKQGLKLAPNRMAPWMY